MLATGTDATTGSRGMLPAGSDAARIMAATGCNNPQQALPPHNNRKPKEGLPSGYDPAHDWDGLLINLTAFTITLNKLISADPVLWSFLLHGHYQSGFRTIVLTQAQALHLTAGSHPTGTWEHPVNIEDIETPFLFSTPSGTGPIAGRTRGATGAEPSAQPDLLEPAPRTPALPASHIIASKPAHTEMDHKLFTFITARISDEALVEQLKVEHEFSGRSLAAYLIWKSTAALTPAEKNTLAARFEQFRDHHEPITTRKQFAAFVHQYNNLKAGLPAELHPNEATVASHWRTAVARGNVERARQLELAIGLAVAQGSVKDDLVGLRTSIELFLTQEETLQLEHARHTVPPAHKIDAATAVALISQAVAAARLQPPPDPRKTPRKPTAPTSKPRIDTSKPWKPGDPPCHHCGAGADGAADGHWMKNCTHADAGTGAWMNARRAARKAAGAPSRKPATAAAAAATADYNAIMAQVTAAFADDAASPPPPPGPSALACVAGEMLPGTDGEVTTAQAVALYAATLTGAEREAFLADLAPFSEAHVYTIAGCVQVATDAYTPLSATFAAPQVASPTWWSLYSDVLSAVECFVGAIRLNLLESGLLAIPAASVERLVTGTRDPASTPAWAFRHMLRADSGSHPDYHEYSTSPSLSRSPSDPLESRDFPPPQHLLNIIIRYARNIARGAPQADAQKNAIWELATPTHESVALLDVDFGSPSAKRYLLAALDSYEAAKSRPFDWERDRASLYVEGPRGPKPIDATPPPPIEPLPPSAVPPSTPPAAQPPSQVGPDEPAAARTEARGGVLDNGTTAAPPVDAIDELLKRIPSDVLDMDVDELDAELEEIMDRMDAAEGAAAHTASVISTHPAHCFLNAASPDRFLGATISDALGLTAPNDAHGELEPMAMDATSGETDLATFDARLAALSRAQLDLPEHLRPCPTRFGLPFPILSKDKCTALAHAVMVSSGFDPAASEAFQIAARALAERTASGSMIAAPGVSNAPVHALVNTVVQPTPVRATGNALNLSGSPPRVPPHLVGRAVRAVLDSGCTFHTHNVLADMCNVRPHNQAFYSSTGAPEISIAVGDMPVFVLTAEGTAMLLNLTNVRCLPTHAQTLISAHQLTDSGAMVHFSSSSSITLPGAGSPPTRTVPLEWYETVYVMRIVPVARLIIDPVAIEALMDGRLAPHAAMSLVNVAGSTTAPADDPSETARLVRARGPAPRSDSETEFNAPPHATALAAASARAGPPHDWTEWTADTATVAAAGPRIPDKPTSAYRDRHTRGHLDALSPNGAAACFHARLHCSLARLRAAARPNVASGMPSQITRATRVPTGDYDVANAMRLPHTGTFVGQATRPGEVIHMDIGGPYHPDVFGNRYFAVFVDGYSRYTWAYAMARRSDIPHFTRRFIADFTALANAGRAIPDLRVTRMRTDNAGELASLEYYELMDENAISHEFSPAHVHQLNGVAERRIGLICRIVRSMFEAAGADTATRRKYAMHGVLAALDVLNSTPSDPKAKRSGAPDTAQSPLTRLNSQIPDVLAILPFMCAAVVSKSSPYIEKSSHGSRGWSALNLGRSADTPGAYHLLLNDGKRIVTTSDVRFDETFFPLRAPALGSPANPAPRPPLVLLLFSGDYHRDDGIANFLADRGFLVAQVDNDPTHGGGWKDDILNNDCFNDLVSSAAAGRYHAVFASPPCSTCSVARHLPKDPPGPPPVRTRVHADGLPPELLDPAHAVELRRANEIYRRTALVLSTAHSNGATIVIESPADRGDPSCMLYMHPEHAPLWRTTHIAELVTSARLETVTFAQCVLGSKFRKDTTLAYSPAARPSLAPLARLQCDHAQHARRAAGRDMAGAWRSVEAQRYPTRLNHILAAALSAPHVTAAEDPPSRSTRATAGPSSSPAGSSTAPPPPATPQPPPVDSHGVANSYIEVHWPTYTHGPDGSHWFRAYVAEFRLQRNGTPIYRCLYENPGGEWAPEDIDRWHRLDGPSAVDWRRPGTYSSSATPISPPTSPPPPPSRVPATVSPPPLTPDASPDTVMAPPASAPRRSARLASTPASALYSAASSLPCHAVVASALNSPKAVPDVTPPAPNVRVPRSHAQAMKLDPVRWRAAELAELEAHRKAGSWEMVDLTTVEPGRRVLQFVWSYKLKRDGTYKARLCVDGRMQVPGEDYDQNFSSALRSSSLRWLVAHAARVGARTARWDLRSAFLQGVLEPDEYIYAIEPPGYGTDTKDSAPRVAKVIKPIYGMVQAGRRFQRALFPWLISLGFTQGTHDPCIFTLRRSGDEVVLGVYVDDVAVVYNRSGPGSLYALVHDAFFKRWDATDEGELCDLLNVHVRRNADGSITLHQAPYVKTMLDRYLPDGVPNSVQRTSTPCDASLPQLVADAAVETPTKDEKLRREYQSLVGALLYAAVNTRPDIAYSVGMLSRVLSRPSRPLLDAAYRVLCYLARHSDVGLTFAAGDCGPLVAYSDASWDEKYSTTGWLVMYQKALVNWASKRQKCIATSTFHAELVAATEAAKELVHEAGMDSELAGTSPPPNVLNVDNKALVDVAYNPEHHDKTKHISRKEFFVREQVEEFAITVRYVNSADNLADFFTKYLPPKTFFPLRDRIMNIARPHTNDPAR